MNPRKPLSQPPHYGSFSLCHSTRVRTSPNLSFELQADPLHKTSPKSLSDVSDSEEVSA